MNGYRIKIEVVAVSVDHAVGLAQQAAKYLPDSWSVGSAIGNVEVTVELCKIGEREEDIDATKQRQVHLASVGYPVKVTP